VNPFFAQPTFSKQWLGRPFVLKDTSISWGRYGVLITSDHSELQCEARDNVREILREGSPSEIAKVFEHLLTVAVPSDLSHYLLEMQALATYFFAREHVEVLKRPEFSRDKYEQGRSALAAAFQAALAAVFQAALPLHGLATARFVRYRQILHGMHLVNFADDNESYEAAFTPHLVLECISKDRDLSRLWP
jgi:hypothetical protein